MATGADMAKRKPQRRTNGHPVAKKSATKKPTKADGDIIAVPIAREYPPGQIGVLANHFAIQQDGPEFHLLFFQTHPPLILVESEQERRDLLAKAEARSVCVARLIVSAERLPSFIEAMQSNLDKYQLRVSEKPTKGTS